MDVKRMGKWAAAVAVGLYILAGTAHAASPAAGHPLRTSRISQKSATGTVTFADWGNPEGSTSGRILTDSLVVIDEIDFTAIADVADENWTLVVKDDSGDEMFRLMQTVTASTADNIAKVFPSGLPLWNGSTAANVFSPASPLVPCSSGYSIVVTNAVGTGYLTVFWHMELPLDRAR
jgi:hypothetical protein